MPDVEFVLYEPSDFEIEGVFDGLENVEKIKTPIPSEGRIKKNIAASAYWPRAKSFRGLDRVEWFHLPVFGSRSPDKILTIHDVRSLEASVSSLPRILTKAVIKTSIDKVRHTVTVSNSMRNNILEHFPGTDVSVIYNGLNTEVFSIPPFEAMADVRLRYNLPNEFILSVGHFESRKNYLRLLESIALLREYSVSCPLVIVGNDSGSLGAVRRRARDLKIAESVFLLQGLSDVEVRAVYHLCSLVAFVSSYEGFGLPVLEAMASGRPMVLSDLPVFREITKEGSVYVPHDDIEAIATALARLLSDTAERSRHIERGVQRARDFDFDKLALQLASLHRRLSL